MQYVRLKKNSDFQRLFKKGKRVFSSCLTIIYSPAKKSTVMGIALSKKHGKAVKRNRIKRLIRAAFSNSIGLLDVHCSIIILPKVCESYSYGCIEKSIISCLKKINNESA